MGDLHPEVILHQYKILLIKGPGSYKHGGDIDPIGMYYCSKYADSKASTFTKAKRETTKIRNISPGPGMYKLQTEFGYVFFYNNLGIMKIRILTKPLDENLYIYFKNIYIYIISSSEWN